MAISLDVLLLQIGMCVVNIGKQPQKKCVFETMTYADDEFQGYYPDRPSRVLYAHSTKDVTKNYGIDANQSETRNIA